VVVTISISVRPLPSAGTPPRVKRLVSLLPGELVCYVVPRRPRTEQLAHLVVRCCCSERWFGFEISSSVDMIVMGPGKKRTLALSDIQKIDDDSNACDFL